MARLRLRPDLALLAVCVGLYIVAAAQVRTPRGSALALTVNTLATPIVGVADALTEVWESYVVGRANLAATLAQLGRLRREVAELHHTNQLLAADLLALRQGSRLLAAFPSLADHAVLARVVARDPVLTHTARLDRGRLDGVRLDAPVIADRGVFGRVDRVLDHGSRVQLLTHPAAAAAARLVGGDAEGLLLGGDRPTLTGLPPYSKVAPGTPVATTGSEGIYPPGLLLGTAEDARTEGLFTVVPVRLAVRPAEVAVVLVVQPMGATKP